MPKPTTTRIEKGPTLLQVWRSLVENREITTRLMDGDHWFTVVKVKRNGDIVVWGEGKGGQTTYRFSYDFMDKSLYPEVKVFPNNQS